jgi:triacylglycerol lipase
VTLAVLLRSSITGLLLCAGLWLVGWWHLGWPLVAVIGAASIGFVHAPIMALEFALAHWKNIDDPAPAASAAEIRRAWWAEVVGAIVVFGWQVPWRSTRYPDHLPPDAAGRRGLVLVHGFVCNRGIWNPWWPRLLAQGAPVVALNLEPVFASIDDYAVQIDTAVRQVAAVTGRPPLLVAHSMGGLAIRAWMRRFDADNQVHRVITVGTPHRGTWLARFGHGPNGREMRMLSPWFNTMATSEALARRTKFTCYYSHCDNIVFPCSSATLPDAENHHLRGHGHVHLLAHPAILDEVVRLLRE